MNSFHSPVKTAGYEPTGEDREASYLARDATIRTVVSSDSIHPRRPSFFSESARNRDIVSFAREELPEANGCNFKVDLGRPQTSPRTFFLDNDLDEQDIPWPPSNSKRGILSNSKCNDGSFGSAREMRGSENATYTTRSSSAPSRDSTIVDLTRLEKQHSGEGRARKTGLSSGKSTPPLSLDTTLEIPRPMEGSWILSPSPGTPTVTLQKDGVGEKVEILGDDDDIRNRMVDEEPSEEDKEMARKIFEGNEEFVSKARAAAWLGDAGPSRSTVRKAYMELFDWAGVNILSSMRIFCGRVVFKGETQQVDRIMVAFADRWCECNPNHGFKNADIVHTILYSLLLLNTDLHLAEIPNSQKMTRGQFIKNTMTTIRRGLQESMAFDEHGLPRAQVLFRRTTDDESPQIHVSSSVTFPMSTNESKGHKNRPSLESGRDFKGSRLSRIGNLSPRLPLEEYGENQDIDPDGSLALVSSPLGGGLRLWEAQIEVVLKDFYQSVKASALPLHGSSQEKIELPPSNGLNVFGSGGMLRRSPSTISRAPSDMSTTTRSRDNSKLGTKWASKNRSRQRVYNGSYAGSSRTSLEDRSVWSPSASSTWSKYTLDKTQTSMSVDSLSSAFTHAGDYHQSIGFANALSSAIIREEGASATSATSVEDREIDLLEGDEELALAGAPWAKEGLLKHKHHLETVDKRAKNRGWTECFAVIERGHMRLFQFPSKTGKSAQFTGGVVGGGNWTENAEPIGTFLLRQTIASALPPPGYSKSRPNVWALSLPSGAVHFFEVGTVDIVKEFVTTANYWSARLSKEPLIGGVSNVEYGWGECIADLDTSISLLPTNHGDPYQHGRPSLQMSIRSSMDHGAVRPRLPGDKIHIKDWSPPSQSMMASHLNEQDQLKALGNYVLSIEAELSKHNELRPAMLLAFSPRHPNSGKAMGNWEKKSSYLLREIIKFRTYIETLQSAIQRREIVKAENVEKLSLIARDIEDEDINLTPRVDKSREMNFDL